MQSIQLIAGIVAASVALGGTLYFNRYSRAHFGHRFFGIGSLLASGFALMLLLAGINVAAPGGSDMPLVGIPMALAGVAIAVIMTTSNIHATSLAVGLGGSALQMLFGLVGLAIALPALLIRICLGMGARAEDASMQAARRGYYGYADND